MAGSTSSLCLKSFWFILLISITSPFYRGSGCVYLEDAAGIWTCHALQKLCLLVERVYSNSIRFAAVLLWFQRRSLWAAWQGFWRDLTLQSIVYLQKYYYILHIYYSSLVLKLTLHHKIALRFQSFEQKLFLSLDANDSTGKCRSLCISIVPFYELWVMAGKYKREQRSRFDVHKRLW